MLIPPMAEILDRIETFLERHAMPPTSFGRAATGEPQLIKSMKDGRSPSHRVLERVAAFMADYDSANAPAPGATSTDNREADIGQREPEPAGHDPAAASGRAPGPVLRQAQDERVVVAGPGDSLHALRPSLFDFAAGRAR